MLDAHNDAIALVVDCCSHIIAETLAESHDYASWLGIKHRGHVILEAFITIDHESMVAFKHVCVN